MTPPDKSLWPVIVGGLLTLAGSAAGTVTTIIRDSAQRRHDDLARRADKFEEMVAALYEFDHWLDQTRSRVFEQIEGAPETVSPFAKVQSIAAIYFPRFNGQVRMLDAASSVYVAWLYNPKTTEFSKTGNTLDFKEVYGPYVEKREELLSALSEAAREGIK